MCFARSSTKTNRNVIRVRLYVYRRSVKKHVINNNFNGHSQCLRFAVQSRSIEIFGFALTTRQSQTHDAISWRGAPPFHSNNYASPDNARVAVLPGPTDTKTRRDRLIYRKKNYYKTRDSKTYLPVTTRCPMPTKVSVIDL